MLENIKKIKTEELLKILIIVSVFIMCFCWACSQPYDSAPDEYMKYDLCEYLVQHNSFPHGGDEEIRNPIWGISYGFMPILAYMISAVFVKFAMLFTQNHEILVIAARMTSVIFNTLTVYMIIKISDELFEKIIYKVFFIISIAFLPQFAFIGSYINNDSFALFTISIIIYAWILGLKNKWNTKSCVLLGIGVGLCALSYYNAYGYILISIILYIISNITINKETDTKTKMKKALLIFIIAFLIAGWWFIRNAIIYNGDFLGLKTEKEYGNLYALPEHKPDLIKTPQKEGVSVIEMLTKMKWLSSTFYSFIGTFGYMSILINMKIYYTYLIFYIIAIIGVLINFKKMFILKKNENNAKVLLNYCFIFSIIIPIILSIYYSYTSDFEPQGRYIMPMLIPFYFFIVYGIKTLLEKLKQIKVISKIKNIDKIENIIIIILIICSILICLYCLFGIIIPYYHR